MQHRHRHWLPVLGSALCLLELACSPDVQPPAEGPAVPSDALTEVAEDAAPDAAADATTADAAPDLAADALAEVAPDVAPDVPGIAAEVAIDVAADVSVNTCVCGNGKCDGACGETTASCVVDCASCGDGVCSPGEGPKNCATDCCGGCGDGICKGYDCAESPTVCPVDCGNSCGNGKCDKGESPSTCSEDCKKQACGNGVCEPEDGGPSGCPNDCGLACGDCKCDKGENFVNCPVDCGFCGDGVCSNCTTLGETKETCVQDCKADACKGFDLSKCDDGIACTKDFCSSTGACLNMIKPAFCADGSACTSDSCDLGLGCVNAKIDCDDAEACTVDSCDAASGCVHAATGAPCDDGDPCTVGEICTVNGCDASTAKGCDDGEVCTVDKCQGTICIHLPADVSCVDDNICTVNDVCKAGACKGGGPLDCNDSDDCTLDLCQNGCKHVANVATCDDKNLCTNDFCDSQLGCVHLANAVTCSDGEACTLGDHCADSSCQAGAPKVCDDGVACTKDYCSGGVCKAQAGVGGCDDDNVCTDDACATGSGCTHTANSFGCDDGDGCTVGDKCKNSVCAGPTAKDCSDGTTCTNDDCVDGSCVHTPVPGQCEDGNACSGGDVCQNGTCAPGATVTCDDGNSCTSESCDPASGCTAGLVANGTVCATGLCLYGACDAQCPAGTQKVDLDDDGVKKTVCPFLYPVWGNRPLSPATYVDKGDGTVYDAQTALYWQQTGAGTATPWDAAVVDCNGLVLGGKTDWRLPTLAELASLVDYTTSSPALDSGHFGSTGGLFWSSERVIVPWSANAWTVDYTSGTYGTTNANSAQKHRCVRGGKPTSAVLTKRFRDNGNGTATDLATTLTWQQTLSSDTRSKVASDTYCQGLTLGGGGWRVPTIRELVDLLDRSTASPWLDPTAFAESPGAAYWSSTYKPNSTTDAWYNDSGTTPLAALYGASASFHTRCVRETGGCVVAADCDDFNPCTTENCSSAGACSHSAVADTTNCGGTGLCQSGACACPADTTAVSVDSDVVCALDYPVWGNRPLTPNTFVDNGNATISDSQTGLIWQKNEDSNTFTWNGARDYCNALTLNNKNDWRMPTAAELESLVDYGTHYWAIDNKFGGANSTSVWTAVRASGGKHWATEWYWGISSTQGGWQATRCVRGKPATQPYAARWLDNGDGTVQDKGTGLIWQQDADAPPMPKADAATYCTGLALAGGGWRLPNVREVMSLLHRVDSTASVLMDKKAFPTATADWLWTINFRHGSTTDAWQVNFGLALSGSYFDPATNSVRVRCVK